MSQIGIITEQGDLGLGFDPLNKKDEKVYNEAVERQQNDTDKKDKNSVING
jgi:acetyl-CoA carboxylase beta subunit